MSLPVFVHESAEIEINEAADFYDLTSPGLGNEFLDEIQHAIEDIGQFPEAGQRMHGKIRVKTLIRFPYMLFYSVQSEHIRLLAVAHQKRRPFYWRER